VNLDVNIVKSNDLNARRQLGHPVGGNLPSQEEHSLLTRGDRVATRDRAADDEGDDSACIRFAADRRDDLRVRQIGDNRVLMAE